MQIISISIYPIRNSNKVENTIYNLIKLIIPLPGIIINVIKNNKSFSTKKKIIVKYVIILIFKSYFHRQFNFHLFNI